MHDYEIINENLRAALAAFSHVRTTGKVTQGKDVAFAYAGVPYALFNTALVTSQLPSQSGDFKDCLDRADDFFQRYSAPWSVWFCEDFLEKDERRRARIALAIRGMKLTMEAPGMIAEQIVPARNSLPAMLCKEVRDERTRLDFSTVMSTAFQVPAPMARDVYAGELLWRNPMSGWIGYVAGQPVSTAVTVTAAEAIGLYAVATVPAFQKKGYGEGIMRMALEEASRRSGIKRAVLQSTSIGYSLYVRMGFRHIVRYLVFTK